MRLWILNRKPGRATVETGWDEMESLVVRASSKYRARIIAMSHAGDEGQGIWSNSSLTTCEEILEEGSSEIICRNYKRG